MRRGKRKQPQKHSPAAGKWSIVLLALLAFACYVQTLRYEFVVDDDSQILNNKFVTEPGHLKEIFLKNVWAFVNPEHKSNYYWRSPFSGVGTSAHFGPWAWHGSRCFSCPS